MAETDAARQIHHRYADVSEVCHVGIKHRIVTHRFSGQDKARGWYLCLSVCLCVPICPNSNFQTI